MFKRSLYVGITAAIASSAGAIMYASFFNNKLFDYSHILSYTSIAAACTFVCVFAAIMFWTVQTVVQSWGEILFNFLFAIGSMGSIAFPIDSTVENAEFFAVYAIPLHFFPILAWFVLKPVFLRK